MKTLPDIFPASPKTTYPFISLGLEVYSVSRTLITWICLPHLSLLKMPSQFVGTFCSLCPPTVCLKHPVLGPTVQPTGVSSSKSGLLFIPICRNQSLLTSLEEMYVSLYLRPDDQVEVI